MQTSYVHAPLQGPHQGRPYFFGLHDPFAKNVQDVAHPMVLINIFPEMIGLTLTGISSHLVGVYYETDMAQLKCCYGKTG